MAENIGQIGQIEGNIGRAKKYRATREYRATGRPGIVEDGRCTKCSLIVGA